MEEKKRELKNQRKLFTCSQAAAEPVISRLCEVCILITILHWTFPHVVYATVYNKARIPTHMFFRYEQ